MYGGNRDFDGNAAFSGGGFMPSMATQSADPSSSSYSSSKNRETQPMVPLTVKQISGALQAGDDKVNFLIDGVDVNNVKLVGLMYKKEERVTDISFTLDDGTGRIDCFRWVNEHVDTKEMEAVSDGMYVRVHGGLKGFQGKKQLMVFSVRPLTDFNEITNHFADAIYVHIYNTKLRRLQDAASVPAHFPNSAVNTPSKGYQAPSGNHFPGQYNKGGLLAIAEMISEFLSTPACVASERGVHLNECVQKLGVPMEKIKEAMEYLESEGLVYTTINEHHYKSAANA
ncbi:hypothetical protein LIER_23645 [Lithospermum erythrorhizon]|uniref:Uncharacterized protein n=1 Tax=Lithospermum erythrorhizon TaxID=34254 RepID=A0AAV3QZI6_LITER